MPDWSYRTLFRPILSRMKPESARAATLHAIGAVSRFPGGALLIRTLGHMEPAPQLAANRAGLRFETPVGLSGRIDPSGTAWKALAQFGFGFIEVGPITIDPVAMNTPIIQDNERERLVFPHPYANAGIDAAERALKRRAPAVRGTPLFARTRHNDGATVEESLEAQSELAERLLPYADGWVIEAADSGWQVEDNVRYIRKLAKLNRWKGRDLPAFLALPLALDRHRLDAILDAMAADSELWSGVVLGDTYAAAEEAELGPNGKERTIPLLRTVRSRFPEPFVVIASAGVHEPHDALDLMREGASFVQLSSGLVFAGPNLPKRVNEAILHERIQATPPPKPDSFWKSWGWIVLLGIGMMIGGALAWLISATTVLLAYDEQFLGMTRTELAALNGRLLHFMSHDRTTLAGTMISIGIMYAWLAWNGLRRRLHWARTAMLTSGTVGFSSFFLYLGFGYFDPLHAAVAALLLPLFVLGMRHGGDLPSRVRPNVRNDAAWRKAMWGQLCFVAAGFGLAVGGTVIAVVGITGVFVPSDLVYLGMEAETLNEMNPRLLPLIAHDRAGFGGALLSDALAILITALWGIQERERWIWWMLLLAGLPGFIAGIGVHAAISYTDFLHLLPAYFIFGLYAAGLFLLYPYLCGSHRRTADG